MDKTKKKALGETPEKANAPKKAKGFFGKTGKASKFNVEETKNKQKK